MAGWEAVEYALSGLGWAGKEYVRSQCRTLYYTKSVGKTDRYSTGTRIGSRAGKQTCLLQKQKHNHHRYCPPYKPWKPLCNEIIWTLHHSQSLQFPQVYLSSRHQVLLVKYAAWPCPGRFIQYLQRQYLSTRTTVVCLPTRYVYHSTAGVKAKTPLGSAGAAPVG